MIDVIKKKWKMILALAAVAIFIFEIIALGVLGGGGRTGGGSAGEIISGTTEFSGALRTYDPYLVVQGGLDEDMMTEIREVEGVKDIRVTVDGTVIDTETRDDVYPLAVYLREKNISALGVANIAMPSFLEATLSNGSLVNISTGNFATRVVTEPIVDVDTQVTIKMIVYVTGGMLYGYDSPTLVSEEKEVEVEAVVLEVDRINTFTIPWDERDEVDFEELEEWEVDYQRKNTVFFAESITLEEVMEKKELYYITYIDQYSAECEENFTDVEQLEDDFGGNLTLPDSTLIVISDSRVSLDFDRELVYHYVITLPDEAEGIKLGTDEIELESEEDYDEEDEVTLTITGTVIGNEMVAIKNVVLKE